MILDPASHQVAPAFTYSSGPKDAKIALVGEAWGEEEDKIGAPFVGYSGQELTRMLREAGLSRGDCFLTNVLAVRPPNNNLDFLCGKRADVGASYTYPPLKSGNYLLPPFLGELDRLNEELRTVSPNLIVALGNVACWALLGTTGITKLRGTVNESKIGIKVLPTYHPAAIMRQWSWRPITLADLMKAKHECEFSEIRRPERYVTVRPTFNEIEQWYYRYAVDSQIMAVDIETRAKQIHCIGFATSPKYAIVIDFLDMSKPDYSYWSEEDEVQARHWVQRFLDLPCAKVFQNGVYDIQYLLREGFKLRNCSEDTMLLHHSLFPELPKGLGFLGSIYSNEASWKLMRLEKMDTEKRDE